jgi:hypothetical protein
MAFKLAMGTLCGLLAFWADDWDIKGNNFVFWSLLAIAGNFYANVVMEAGAQAWRGEGSASPIQRSAGKLLTNAMSFIGFIAFALGSEYGLAQLMLEYQNPVGYGYTWTEMGIATLCTVSGMVAAAGAGRTGYLTAHYLFRVVDRMVYDRPIWSFLQLAAGLVGFVLAVYVAFTTYCSVSLGLPPSQLPPFDWNPDVD